MRIVFTGGPSSGKTTIINELAKEFTVVQEPARHLLSVHGNVLFTERERFQNLLEELCIENFNKYPNAFYDRGLHDEIAYRKHFNCEISDKLHAECKNLQYDIVFVFPPWKEIFENDAIRKETFEEAAVIYDGIVAGYREYGLEPIVVPFGTVEERVNFIKSNSIPSKPKNTLVTNIGFIDNFIDSDSLLRYPTHIVSHAGKGKTAILAAIASNLVRQDNKRIYVLNDTNAKDFATKFVSHITGTSIKDLIFNDAADLKSKIQQYKGHNSSTFVKFLPFNTKLDEYFDTLALNIEFNEFNVLILDLPSFKGVDELIRKVKSRFGIPVFSTRHFRKLGMKFNQNLNNFIVLNDEQNAVDILTNAHCVLQHPVQIDFQTLKIS